MLAKLAKLADVRVRRWSCLFFFDRSCNGDWMVVIHQLE
jgi:hypothetical protein